MCLVLLYDSQSVNFLHSSQEDPRDERLHGRDTALRAGRAPSRTVVTRGRLGRRGRRSLHFPTRPLLWPPIAFLPQCTTVYHNGFGGCFRLLRALLVQMVLEFVPQWYRTAVEDGSRLAL